jgi:hypothetical protein
MSEHRALLEKEMARLSPSPVTVEGVWRRHARRERNQRVMAGALVLVIFVAIVGWLGVALVNRAVTPADEPTRPSPSELFLREGQLACIEKQAALDRMDLRRPGFTEYSRSAVREIRQVRVVYATFVQRLRSIPLPPGDQRAVDMVTLWGRVPERIDDVLRSARQGREGQFERNLVQLWPLLDRAFVTSVGYGICSTEASTR